MTKIELKVGNFIEKLKAEIQKEYSSKFEAHGLSPQNDSLLQSIGMLYQDKVGDPFTEDKLKEIFQEGEIRYASQVPPGFLDAPKGDDRKYGDLILWKEMLRYAAATKVDILFVTDDAKEDWWWKSQGETIGPLPELRHEFTRETGQIFYSYSPVAFIEKIGKSIDANIATSLLDEVANTSRMTSENRSPKYVTSGTKEIDGIARGRAISKRYLQIRDLERSLDEYRSRLAQIDGKLSATHRNYDQIEADFNSTLLNLGRLDREMETLEPHTTEAYDAIEYRESLTYKLDKLRTDKKTLQSIIDDLIQARGAYFNGMSKIQNELSSEEFKHLTSEKPKGRKTEDINMTSSNSTEQNIPF